MSKSLVPQIRFKGFTAPWEQRCFSDIAEVRRGLTYTPDHLTNTKINSIRVLRSSNIFDGSFICSDKDDVFVTKNIVRIKTIKNGEILVTAANGSSALVGKHCIVQGVSDSSAVHGGFMLAVKTSFPGFLQASMNSEWYEKFIKIYSSGGNGSIGNLSGSVLLKQEIPIPEEHEIKQIGVFFEKIDSLITLHQRKCDLLKNLKKSLLEKLFPKNNKSTPEIRFKGFTDAWEQYKLGDCSEYTIGGGTPDTSNTQFWKGVIPWIQSSDLTEGSCFQVSIRKYISQKAIAASATRLVPKNSLSIITRVGVGKLALLPFDYCTSQDFLSFVSLKIDKKFSVYAIGLILNDIKKSLQGTSIKGITKNEIISSKIIIPKVSEQNKIGSTLFRIDSLITLHQRKLEKLKNIKKSLLEKMFV